MIPVMKVAFNDIQQETVTDDKGQVASPCLDCKWSVKSSIIINLQSGGPSSLFIFEATFLLSPQKRMSNCRLSVADPGEGPSLRPRPPSLISRPNWGPKCQKFSFLETGPPPYLKVWIWHWLWYYRHKIFITKIKTFHQYVSLTVKRINLSVNSHFKYPSAWQDILYFRRSISFI